MKTTAQKLKAADKSNKPQLETKQIVNSPSWQTKSEPTQDAQIEQKETNQMSQDQENQDILIQTRVALSNALATNETLLATIKVQEVKIAELEASGGKKTVGPRVNKHEFPKGWSGRETHETTAAIAAGYPSNRIWKALGKPTDSYTDMAIHRGEQFMMNLFEIHHPKVEIPATFLAPFKTKAEDQVEDQSESAEQAEALEAEAAAVTK